MSQRFRPFDFERGPFNQQRDIRLPRPPRRFWIAAGFFGLAILVLILGSPIVWFVTELQWYDGLGLKDVFTTRLLLQAYLFIGSFVAAFTYITANVLIALRVRAGPALRAVGIKRASVRSVTGAIALIGAALIAVVLSGGAGTQWQTLALFQHSANTGVTESVLGQDVAFYLLTLPFMHSVVNWALGLGFMATLLVGALYAWRGDTFDFNLGPRMIAHLSVMLAAFALVLAAWTWLGRFDLLFAHNDKIVWGAGYTDVNARLPLLTFEAAVAVVLAVALVANVWLHRTWMPAVAAGLWVALLAIGQLYPSVVQNFFVTPSAQSYELPYIQNEIAGTRAAYGLTNVTTKDYTGDQPVTLAALQNDQATIDNLRLWDYTPLQDTYEQLQTIRTYYHFTDIDIDRYTVDGKYKQLEISAREFSYEKLPAAAQNWVNQHLQYTHGYGVAASPVNAVVGEGLPAYVVRDLPPIGSLKISQPGIYFGELTNSYVLAPSGVKEFDYPQGSQDVYASYTGTHGVKMAGLNKTLWSMKLGDFNLLVSPQVTDQSQMLYRRNIVDRVTELAPFLSFDQDPYVVIGDDGRIYWIIDAYTTGSTYPYSQTVDLSNGASINYIRNSVKVVIDAYEGTTSFYIVDPKDPIISAYSATFPSLFKPIDAMPSSLRAHLRVPEDMFSIQVRIYATYHITDPKVFFAREDVWEVPTGQTAPGAAAQPLQPYYVLFRLPGEQNPEYLLITPFTPRQKQNMIAWLAARNDPDHYGQMVSYVLPKDKVVFGPQQVANRINENPAISRDFSLFHQAGSQVVQGNLLVVPLGDSFLYFEPIYLRANQPQSLPELKKVILADSANVVYADTLQQAIDQLVGTAPTTTPPTGGPVSPPGASFSVQVANLTQQALLHYTAAYAAMKNGDLTTFGSEMAQVGQILNQLQSLSSGQVSASPSPSPSPTR